METEKASFLGIRGKLTVRQQDELFGQSVLRKREPIDQWSSCRGCHWHHCKHIKLPLFLQRYGVRAQTTIALSGAVHLSSWQMIDIIGLVSGSLSGPLADVIWTSPLTVGTTGFNYTRCVYLRQWRLHGQECLDGGGGGGGEGERGEAVRRGGKPCSDYGRRNYGFPSMNI